ncbi:MAG: hypothetical protein NVS4B13_08130 [Candidatus Elarobacter sp.]
MLDGLEDACVVRRKCLTRRRQAAERGVTSQGHCENGCQFQKAENRWLIFFFYPLDFTFVCPTEIVALSDRLDEFAEIHAEIVGASTDSVHSHVAWLNTPRDKN